MTKVTLSTMRLRVLPSAVLQNPQVESLNLDRNKLKYIPGISKLRCLQKLILSKNEIADFPVEIQCLVHLEKLELNQNQIRLIPEGVFSCLPRLRHLRLNNNRLSDLPKDLATCSGSLQYLNLSNNLFRALPQAVVELVSLQELCVQNNALHQLPRELFEGRPLKMFKANGNPLREPPSEVCAGGIQQILSYFCQLQNCQVEEDRRVKTMFLGASLAGKSTICKSLKQQQAVMVSEEERTVGIEISEFHIQDFTFLFWDFAGQLEYYVTHHVFITPQALVILVINFQKYQINNDIFQELVGFWINNLFMRVPNSVVLPVGTHIDCCTEEEVEEKKQDIMGRIQAMLEERKTALAHFINNLEASEESEFYVDQWDRLKEMESCILTILDLVPVNCTDYWDIKKLETTILEHVKNEEIFPNVIRVLPPVYKEVEAAVVDIVHSEETAEHGMMDLNHLLSEITHREHLAHLSRELFQDILRYLHRIGLIIWYEEIKQLENMVFLRPAFLITMFKILVRYRLVQQLESISVDLLVGEHATIRDQSNWVWTFKSKAMLCQRAMRALVKHQLYSEGKKDVFEEMVGHKTKKGKLFSLLEHFEICLEVRNVKNLNPGAREFVPGKPWETTQDHGEACYLFPTYLNQSKEVSERWGGDHPEDLHIRAYFSPEIPEGFFQRLMVKACSFYSAHWVAKVMCLLICSGKPLLIKENNQRGYSYIELRSRKPVQRTEFQVTWDFVMAIIFIIQKLSEEWPGLHMCMKTPCRTEGCPAEFFWPDVDDKNTVTKEEIKTCGTCGQRFRTELLLPKVPSDLEVPRPPPAAHYYVTSYGTTTFGPSSVHVDRQSILDK
ncbi:malignant fibrous histiocytoma-amplified sequence 1 homolog [Carettochelys insculpta]|uniref:malignant fibrous histiocytoma-amplified sequence 1 homolog n=1 Tax=Carettochelys insculpta TaxID=44489 RepID=UPI003EBC6B5A